MKPIGLILLMLTSVVSGKNETNIFCRSAQIGRGINLGNALDAPTEGAWGVRLKAAYFECIADAGFDSIRLPIRWSAHAANEAPYSIEPEFFARVDWAIQHAQENGLVSIINIHHYETMMTDPLSQKERWLALWKQIADHYCEYPETLYFELLNEPNNQLTIDRWNEYLNQAILLIRPSNPQRPLIIGPANWNNLDQLETLQLPVADRNLIAAFHYYAPFHFTHQGASWVGKQSAEWLGTRWSATLAEKQSVIHQFDHVANWSKTNQRPIYLGEFGAYSNADMDSRIRWTAFVRAEAEKRSIAWSYWEFCSGFGVYDPDREIWRKELLNALIPD